MNKKEVEKLIESRTHRLRTDVLNLEICEQHTRDALADCKARDAANSSLFLLSFFLWLIALCFGSYFVAIHGKSIAVLEAKFGIEAPVSKPDCCK